jgi:hypothetical protein
VIAPHPVVDLREAVRARPLQLPGIEALSTEELGACREHWRVHMAAELASARVFAGLVPQMMAASLDASLIRDVSEMVTQELDHGVLSARVYAALGGTPRTTLPSLAPVPDHAGASPIEVVLRNVIAVSCCGETLAVAVIGSERERATLEPLRATLTSILADEVGHARFGWTLLRDVAPALDASIKRRISAYLVAVFERDLAAVYPGRDAKPASEAALAVGAHDGPLAWETLTSTLRAVTVPGLERLGFHADWALATAMTRVGRRFVATPSITRPS